MSDKKEKNEYISIIVPTSRTAAADGEVADVVTSDESLLHAGFLGFGGDAKQVDWNEFHKNWKKIRDQIQTMMIDLKDKTFGDLQLKELEVGLSATGKGSIGIASVSAAANIKLKFVRKES